MILVKTIGAISVATLVFGATPALAQHRGGGGHARSSGGHSGAVHVASPRSFGGARAVAPRAVASPRVFGSSRAVVGSRVAPFGGTRVFAAQHRGGVVVGRAA